MRTGLAPGLARHVNRGPSAPTLEEATALGRMDRILELLDGGDAVGTLRSALVTNGVAHDEAGLALIDSLIDQALRGRPVARARVTGLWALAQRGDRPATDAVVVPATDHRHRLAKLRAVVTLPVIVSVLSLVVACTAAVTGRAALGHQQDQLKAQQSALSTQAEQLDVQRQQLSTQQDALATQKEQLESAQEQFEKAGSIFGGSAYFARWDPTTSELGSGYENKTVGYADMEAPYTLYLVFDIKNSGRSPGTVTDVGVENFDTGAIVRPYEPTLCSPPGPLPVWTGCTFPLAIPAQSEQLIYVPIDAEIQKGLTCLTAKAGSDGLYGEIVGIDGGTYFYPTYGDIAFTNYCEERTPSA